MTSHRVVCLLSGGKDSCYNMVECERNGHQIVALANLHPPNPEKPDSVEDMESWMYQTVGHRVIDAYAKCMDVPLFRRAICGTATVTKLQYVPHQQGGEGKETDEVEDLYELLKEVVTRMPEVTAVASGAILSNYQRTRVESVCSRLGLVSLAYLWQRDQDELLDEMVKNGMHSIVVKVAGLGLKQCHLGRSIGQLRDMFHQLSKLGCNACGEGGEYETLTLDCPVFRHGRIVIDEAKVEGDLDGKIAPVCLYRITKYHVESKEATECNEDTKDGETESKNSTKVDGRSRVNITIKGPGEEYYREQLLCAYCRELAGEVTFRAAVGRHRDTKQAFDACLSQLKDKQLSRGGWHIDQAALTHLYVPDMSKFGFVNSLYKSHFRSSQSSSRACVEFAGDDAIYVDCTLYRPPTKCVCWQNKGDKEGNKCQDEENKGDKKSEGGGQRDTLHVRSVSRWAPACIGPYAQANMIGDGRQGANRNFFGLLAGQIGLIPEKMQLRGQARGDPLHTLLQEGKSPHAPWRLLRNDFRLQLEQTLWNIGQVLQEVKSGWHAVTLVTAYLPAALKPHSQAVEALVRSRVLVWREDKSQPKYFLDKWEVQPEASKPNSLMPAFEERVATVLVVYVPRLPMSAAVEIVVSGLTPDANVDSNYKFGLMKPRRVPELWQGSCKVDQGTIEYLFSYRPAWYNLANAAIRAPVLSSTPIFLSNDRKQRGLRPKPQPIDKDRYWKSVSEQLHDILDMYIAVMKNMSVYDICACKVYVNTDHGDLSATGLSETVSMEAVQSAMNSVIELWWADAHKAAGLTCDRPVPFDIAFVPVSGLSYENNDNVVLFVLQMCAVISRPYEPPRQSDDEEYVAEYVEYDDEM